MLQADFYPLIHSYRMHDNINVSQQVWIGDILNVDAFINDATNTWNS